MIKKDEDFRLMQEEEKDSNILQYKLHHLWLLRPEETCQGGAIVAQALYAETDSERVQSTEFTEIADELHVNFFSVPAPRARLRRIENAGNTILVLEW